ncbi:MAG: formate dehydrogenase accessory sulfurtransferase FdhD, partial [Proteobacteria bacterium]|nr:formate dehydrogenase accessory sulfurtransferase FdhD [Pseudomonadota bacterium]
MGVASWRVPRYREGEVAEIDDVVVEEVPLTLYVNGREVVTLLTLGEHPEELALGFLRSEGFYRTKEEVEAWRV